MFWKMNKKECLGLSQTLYSNLRYFILQLQRHISKSKCHAITIELEKSKEDCDVELIDITQDKSRQTRIDTLALSSSREAYIWMLITAYEIALHMKLHMKFHPNVSLSMFSIFIKAQHQNVEKFISSKWKLWPFIFKKWLVL